MGGQKDVLFVGTWDFRDFDRFSGENAGSFENDFLPFLKTVGFQPRSQLDKPFLDHSDYHQQVFSTLRAFGKYFGSDLLIRHFWTV